MLDSLRPVVQTNEERFRRDALLERLVNPERQIKFRVPWMERCYGAQKIFERHRHRYEFNNDYRDVLQKHGLVLSGLSPDGRWKPRSCPIARST